MIADIRARARRVPFVPFAIRTTDGREYRVPTLDHLWFPPRTSRVMVADDDGVTCSLWALHISAVVDREQEPASKPGA